MVPGDPGSMAVTGRQWESMGDESRLFQDGTKERENMVKHTYALALPTNNLYPVEQTSNVHSKYPSKKHMYWGLSGAVG